jgi:hypothetical protein
MPPHAPAPSPDQLGPCVSCRAPLGGQYCHRCGERVLSEHDFTMAHYVEEAFEAATHIDGKLLGSFRALLTRPGLLTVEYFRGRRQRYMRPFALFLVVNLVFLATASGVMLTAPLANHLLVGPYKQAARRLVARGYAPDATEPARAQAVVAAYVDGVMERPSATAVEPAALARFETYAERFNHHAAVLARSLVVMLIPLLALVIALLHFRWGRNQPLPKHFVFATHLLAGFLVLYMLFSGVLALAIALGAGHAPDWLQSDGPRSVGALVILFLYAGRAFRTFYGDGRLAGWGRATAFTFLFYPVLFTYRAALFFLTAYTLS